MRFREISWMVFALLLVGGWCHADPVEVVLKSEAEELPTTSAIVAQAAPGASGDAMAVLGSAGSAVGMSAELGAGTYTLAFAAWAPDATHDAVYVSTPTGEVRLTMGVFGEWVTLNHTFAVAEDGTYSVVIRADPHEVGVALDEVALLRGTLPEGLRVSDLPGAGDAIRIAGVEGIASEPVQGAADENVSAQAGPSQIRLRGVPQAQHEREIETQFLATFDEGMDADYARGRPNCGNVAGGALVDGRWGQGLDCSADGLKVLYSMERNLLPRSGTLEFWTRSVPGANIWADGEDHYFVCLWPTSQMPGEPRSPVRVELVKRGADNGLHLAVHGGAAVVDLAVPAAELHPEAWHHVAISWDCIELGTTTWSVALNGEGRRVTVNSSGRLQPFFALQIGNAPWLGHYSRVGESAELGGYIDDLHISDEPLAWREEGGEPFELAELDAKLAMRARDAFDKWVDLWGELQTAGAWGPWTSPTIEPETRTFHDWTGRPTDRCSVLNKYGSSIVTVGYDFMDMYAFSGDERCRQIAENSVDFFLRGQDPRGYWYENYTVDESGRIHGHKNEWARIQDGHQSQPFLYLLYWHRLTGDDRAFEAARRNADFVHSIENPNGAWGGTYNVETETPWTTGPRGVPNGSEFNDYATTDALRMMITMYNLTGDEKYLHGPEGSRGIAGIGKWIRDTQMGEGEVRGWCQQYGPDDRPVWSRAFEAPVISPRVVCRFIHPMTLILWLATGNEEYVDLLRETYDWYRSVEAPGDDGGWYYQYLPDGRPATSDGFRTVIIDPNHPDGIALIDYETGATTIVSAEDPEAPRPSRSKLQLSAIHSDLERYAQLGPEGYREALVGSSEVTDEAFITERASALSRARGLEESIAGQVESIERGGLFDSGSNMRRITQGDLYTYMRNVYTARGLISREYLRRGGVSPWEIGGRGWKRPVAAIDDWFDFRLEDPTDE